MAYVPTPAASAPKQEPRLSPDWVMSIESNVHGCNDRGWFTKYTPFRGVAHEALRDSDPGMVVLGIGTVELPVRRSPNKSGLAAHGTLRLTNVLHIPSLLVNIVGQPLMSDCPIWSFGSPGSAKSKGALYDAKRRRVAYFTPHSPLFALRLSGPPIGPQLGRSALSADSAYVIRLSWVDSERRRWEAFQTKNNPAYSAGKKPALVVAKKQASKAENKAVPVAKHKAAPLAGSKPVLAVAKKPAPAAVGAAAGSKPCLAAGSKPGAASGSKPAPAAGTKPAPVPPSTANSKAAKPSSSAPKSVPGYTPEEKQWLKRHHGGEFRFLRRFGLQIYKEDDREEGRLIAREMIKYDSLLASEDEADEKSTQDLEDDASSLSSSEEEDETEDEDEEGSEEEDSNDDGLESYVADYWFSDHELWFIRKHWGDAGMFMTCHDLKFYKPEDCERAVVLLHEIMG